MRKKFIFILIIVLAILSFTSFNKKSDPKIKTPSKNYSVILANTPELRLKGLSGQTSLPNDTVMLFSFENNDLHGIWMKDMLINIDIVFLDENMSVINYFDDVSPATYPAVFYPERNARYVIEMASGERIKSGLDKDIKVYYK